MNYLELEKTPCFLNFVLMTVVGMVTHLLKLLATQQQRGRENRIKERGGRGKKQERRVEQRSREKKKRKA